MVESLGLSGYDDRKELLAQRYNRAGKSLFVIALPLHLIPTHLPIPDPEEPFEGNRRVSSKHAADFAQYWRENERWATPPILLDTMHPLSADFEPRFAAGGVELGIVKLPHNSISAFDILDGQHRILGWKIASERVAGEVKEYRIRLQASKDAQDPIGIKVNTEQLQAAEGVQTRLRNEYITLEVLEGVSVEDHKQIFHDIAVNAKGITKSVVTAFDRRSVINRVALSIADTHPLALGRIDFEKDRVTGGNESWISGKNLADIVRHVMVGIDGRITRRREESFQDRTTEAIVTRFLDALMESFPMLQGIADDEIHVADVRGNDLIGSPTILRALAGSYHLLAVDISDEYTPRVKTEGDSAARKLFGQLAPSMKLPISDEWWATELFADRESKAPSSRAQDLRALTNYLAYWGSVGEPFVYSDE